jgi:hypothetical protein
MIYVQLPAADQSFDITKSFSPSGNFTITAKFYAVGANNYQGVGLDLLSSDELDGVRAYFDWGNAPRFNIGCKIDGAWNWKTAHNVDSQGPVYLHIEWDDTNKDFQSWLSFDGRAWTPYSNAFWNCGAGEMQTVGKMRLAIWNGSATLPRVAAIDWVRVNWIDF